jgi:hypothetical protein
VQRLFPLADLPREPQAFFLSRQVRLDCCDLAELGQLPLCVRAPSALRELM